MKGDPALGDPALPVLHDLPDLPDLPDLGGDSAPTPRSSPVPAVRLLELDIRLDGDGIWHDNITIKHQAAPPDGMVFLGLVGKTPPQLVYRGTWPLSHQAAATQINQAVPVSFMCMCDGVAQPYLGTGHLTIDTVFGDGRLEFSAVAHDNNGLTATGVITFFPVMIDNVIQDDDALITLRLTRDGTTHVIEHTAYVATTLPVANPTRKGITRGLFYVIGLANGDGNLGCFGMNCTTRPARYTDPPPFENWRSAK